MTRILITGAHGFIGKHLALYLSAQGHHVVGLGHGHWSPIEALHWGVKDWVNGAVNLINLHSVQKRCEPEIVFHLAGGSTVGTAMANPHEDFSRTVASSAELLEWMRLDLPDARLIAVSSAAVYGSGFSNPILETAVGVPYSPYGHHKHMMESLCRSYSDSYGIDFRVARLFSVYGPHLKKQLLWDLCARLFSGESPLVLSGSGKELRDWTHVSDVVAALSLVAFADGSAESGRAFNIGTGNGTSVQEISQLVVDVWFGGSGVSSKSALQFSGKSRPGDPFSLVADPERLSRMGFSWKVPLTKGIESFVDWFRETDSK
jgi:UDP-glucose 4-epimerase